MTVDKLALPSNVETAPASVQTQDGQMSGREESRRDYFPLLLVGGQKSPVKLWAIGVDLVMQQTCMG